VLVTFIMPGNAALGPLDENAASLGDSTAFPTTLKVREILTTGILHATKLKHTVRIVHGEIVIRNLTHFTLLA
jgi:hypothetical protein